MSRLTYQEEDGTWGIKGIEWSEIPNELCSRLYGALCKLKDYEKSGFTPQEVEEMRQTYGNTAAKCRYKAKDGRMTMVDARKMLQVMNVCCKGIIFTKSEICQISMVCMKALEREEKEKQNDRE